MSDLKILALSGSLRAGSTNTGLLRAAAAAAPDGVTVQIYDYSNVPLYNGDLEVPAAVEALKQAITQADGVLLATPEYNYSISGVLKNAIDWASRPAYRSPFAGKPTGVISAAFSFVGGARAQQHTKTILMGMKTPVFPWPEFLVGSAHTKFADSELTDDETAKHLKAYVDGFADWVRSQLS